MTALLLEIDSSGDTSEPWGTLSSTTISPGCWARFLYASSRSPRAIRDLVAGPACRGRLEAGRHHGRRPGSGGGHRRGRGGQRRRPEQRPRPGYRGRAHPPPAREKLKVQGVPLFLKTVKDLWTAYDSRPP